MAHRQQSANDDQYQEAASACLWVYSPPLGHLRGVLSPVSRMWDTLLFCLCQPSVVLVAFHYSSGWWKKNTAVSLRLTTCPGVIPLPKRCPPLNLWCSIAATSLQGRPKLPSCSTPTMTALKQEGPSCPVEVIFEEFPFPPSLFMVSGDKDEGLATLTQFWIYCYCS